jgi:thiamine-monophosphate kinase
MESEFIAWLRRRLPQHPRLRLGPGDDAAVLRLGDQPECVVTTDLLTDGVDFLLEEHSPRRIGRKALAVNLSDLAAMAAEPVAVLIALALPRTGGLSLAQELYEGLLPLAEEHQVIIAGGDTNVWDGPLVLSITAIGKLTTHGPLVRGGAKPGDQILVTGQFGGSILGHQFDFQPRISEALLLHGQYQLHAGMDVSDGLSLDLSRLATESQCGAVIEESLVPIAEAAVHLATSLSDGVTPLEHALGDGEDFELLLAVPPNDAQRLLTDQPLDIPVTRIGEFIETPGLWKRLPGGERQELVPRGFQH